MNTAEIFSPSLYLPIGKGQVPFATGEHAGLSAQQPGKGRQTTLSHPFKRTWCIVNRETRYALHCNPCRSGFFLGLHKLLLEITFSVLNLVKWWDSYKGNKAVSACPSMTDGWRGGWLLCCLPSPAQHREWWKQPSALTTCTPRTIYIPENKSSALFSPRKYLKFIEIFFFF